MIRGESVMFVPSDRPVTHGSFLPAVFMARDTNNCRNMLICLYYQMRWVEHIRLLLRPWALEIAFWSTTPNPTSKRSGTRGSSIEVNRVLRIYGGSCKCCWTAPLSSRIIDRRL